MGHGKERTSPPSTPPGSTPGQWSAPNLRPGRRPIYPVLLGLVFALGLPLLTSCGTETDTDETHGSAASPGEGEGYAEAGGRTPLIQGFPLRLQDASGTSLTFQAPPDRIVSLVPSATETLQALGVQDRLVGRTDYDTASSLRHLPSVGQGLGPSLEGIRVLDPDLVIRFLGGSDPGMAATLGNMGIRTMAVRPDRVEDVQALIRDLGRVVAQPERATEILGAMDSTLVETQARLDGRPPVRVAYLLGGDPPWVAGPGTFIDELLSVAGGENAFSDLKMLYGPVSLEEFHVRDIDLFLTAEGSDVRSPRPGIPLRRVPAELEIPGPGLHHSARRLAEILHPEAFR